MGHYSQPWSTIVKQLLNIVMHSQWCLKRVSMEDHCQPWSIIAKESLTVVKNSQGCFKNVTHV